MKTANSGKKIVCIRRDEKYLQHGGGWGKPGENMVVMPVEQARRYARINVGMPCELVGLHSPVIDESYFLAVTS